MDTYKIIALCGKGGSGKDTILNTFVNKYNVNKIIPYTTRNPRENEIDGVDYHFTDAKIFGSKIISGEILEAAVFNEWAYGTSTKSLDKDRWNIGIFSIDSIQTLEEYSSIDLYVFYIDVPDKILLKRILDREENPDINEVIRRFQADQKDFAFINNKINSFTSIKNIDFADIELAIEKIAKTLGITD